MHDGLQVTVISAACVLITRIAPHLSFDWLPDKTASQAAGGSVMTSLSSAALQMHKQCGIPQSL